MTDFDTRLGARLERLDAAVPDPGPLSVTTGVKARMSPWRRRRAVLLIAAAAVLLVTSAAAAGRMLFPDEDEVVHPDIEAAIEETFAGVDCMSAADATVALRARLDALGYADWGIEPRPGTEAGRCVAAGVIGQHHVVALFPAAGRVVISALETVAEELLVDCYNREEAIALLSSAVTSAGLTEFTVSADPGGPEGAPSDRYEEYEKHAAAGCFVYVMMGWDEGGRTVFYLWGD